MANRRLNASDFKARCLALLDEVAASGDALTILKHGKPVAEVRPIPSAVPVVFPPPELRGTVRILGDIVAPVVDDNDIVFDSELS